MTNMYKSEAFKYQDGHVQPGKDWGTIVSVARFNDHKLGRGRREIHKLGISLSGAVSVLGEVQLEISDFTEAAVPPMKDGEATEFMVGYITGNQMLGNTIGVHMPVLETEGIPHE